MGPGRSPMANSCALSSSLERRTSSGGMGIGGDETSSGVELPDELHDLLGLWLVEFAACCSPLEQDGRSIVPAGQQSGVSV